MMYETVVVPTDGSDVSLAAAREAVDIVAPGGTLHALAVIESIPLYKQSGRPKLAEPDRSEKREQLEAATREIAALTEDTDIDGETAIREGVPYREILAYATDVDADAIVLGKRGRGASTSDLLGSTTEHVIRQAHTTIVSVPAM